MDGLIQLSLQYGPYVVVVGVVLLFLLCCYFLFRDGKSKQKHTEQQMPNYDEYYEQRRRNFQNPYAVREGEEADDTDDTIWEEMNPSDYTMPLPAVDATDWNESQGIVSKELVRAVSEQPLEEADDATRIMPKISDEIVAQSDASAAGIPTVEEAFTKGADGETISSDNTAASETTTIADKAVAQYVAAFGILNPKSETAAKYITEYVFSQLGAESEKEIATLLENIAVQEALLQVQKAYVTNPTEWLRDMLADTFCDVVKRPQSSTWYLVAVDALKCLVNMQKGHLQVLALALIVQYSKNSNNYSLENFVHYVEKYLEPLLSELPTREDMYQQLEYLRCTSSAEEVRFEQILRNSYPLVFEYRGFTMEELEYVMQHAPVRTSITVPSLNSNLLKLSAVDEYMSPNLFQRAGITDQDTQQALTGLAFSRAFDWDNTSFEDVLEHISPVLLDLCQTYNRIPLCRLNLTLLGLYLGRSMVKATIHEDFDVSPWFS